MSTHPKLSFDIISSRICPTVGVTVLFDNKVVKQIQCDKLEPYSIEIECLDQEQEHVLEIQLNGKKHSYDDNIIELMVFINNFCVDFVELDRFLISWEMLKYHHNENTDIPTVVQPFDGGMGFDGNVYFNFTSPIYSWLKTNYRHYTK